MIGNTSRNFVLILFTLATTGCGPFQYQRNPLSEAEVLAKTEGLQIQLINRLDFIKLRSRDQREAVTHTPDLDAEICASTVPLEFSDPSSPSFAAPVADHHSCIPLVGTLLNRTQQYYWVSKTQIDRLALTGQGKIHLAIRDVTHHSNIYYPCLNSNLTLSHSEKSETVIEILSIEGPISFHCNAIRVR